MATTAWRLYGVPVLLVGVLALGTWAALRLWQQGRVNNPLALQVLPDAGPVQETMLARSRPGIHFG